MNGKTAFVLGVASMGLYLLYREAKLVPSAMSGLGVAATTGPTPASVQAQLIAGAQQAQTIIEMPIVIPPPPKLIT
jgi:hypothetical protein